jgi:hypothetical protein
MKVFAEVGIGNQTLFNTESELDDGTESRRPGVHINSIQELYIRFWIGYRVFILSTNEGFVTYNKSRRAFKLLFGMGGT